MRFWTVLPAALTACTIEAAPPAGGKDSAAEPCTESTFFFDDDDDGYGATAVTIDACEQPAGYVTAGGDCDDASASVSPGAPELCNDADDDCDGDVDENGTDAPGWYPDADHDGEGDASAGVAACDAPDGFTADSSDCDDTDSAVNTAAEESCNGIDDNCNGDIDEAGATGAPTWYADTDGDGYGDAAAPIDACVQPAQTVPDSADCDDSNDSRHPGADESCDGVDDDCDGTPDDNAVDKPIWWADLDHDGYGGQALSFADCVAPSGYVASTDDCDDTNALVSPGAAESCNEQDDNCDGTVDEDASVDALTWYADTDADGFGDAASTHAACTIPAGYLADDTDCNDADDSVSPAADELCGGADENCDGTVDEDTAVDAPSWYADLDLDGYGDPANIHRACTLPAGYLADASDCDDDEATANPLGTEVCGNGIDEDCNAAIDDGCFVLGTRAATSADAVIAGSVGSYLGYSMAGGVDLDGDGVNDLLAENLLGTYSSGVHDLWIIDGASSGASTVSTSASALMQVEGEVDGLGVGDLDGDGVGDIIRGGYITADVYLGPFTGTISAPTADANLNLETTNRAYGSVVQDFDDDGDADLATAVATITADRTALAINDLWTGTRLVSASTASRTLSSSCGYSGETPVSGRQDYDGDGIDDLLVGDGSRNDCTHAYLLLGPITGTTDMATSAAWTLTAGTYSVTSDRLGASANLVPDVDGDGSADILIGGQLTPGAYSYYGMALLYTGGGLGAATVTSYTAKFTATTSTFNRLGISVGSADLDADGHSEVVLSAETNAGIWFGPVTGTLYDTSADVTITGAESYGELGRGLANLGDVEGYGFDTLALSEPAMSSYLGSIYLFNGAGR